MQGYQSGNKYLGRLGVGTESYYDISTYELPFWLTTKADGSCPE